MNWREIDIIKFLWLNYFCKNVRRHGNGKIIPYKNAIIDLASEATIHIHDGDLSIGVNKLRGSKTETYIRLRSGAVWDAKNRCEISYGSTLEILADAKVDTGYFTMNSFSTIVSAKHISLGEDVMIARNVVIFDSDFHAIEMVGEESAKSAEVKIGNHVWIAANSMILKGVHIEDGSVVAANSLVTKDAKSGVLVGNERTQVDLKESVKWKR